MDNNPQSPLQCETVLDFALVGDPPPPSPAPPLSTLRLRACASKRGSVIWTWDDERKREERRRGEKRDT